MMQLKELVSVDVDEECMQPTASRPALIKDLTQRFLWRTFASTSKSQIVTGNTLTARLQRLKMYVFLFIINLCSSPSIV